MTPEQLEADRIKSLFPILNQHSKFISDKLAIIYVKDVIEILKNNQTVEFYESVLKILEDERP